MDLTGDGIKDASKMF